LNPHAWSQPLFVASADVRPARILARSSGTEETAAEATGVTLPMPGVVVNAYKFPYGSYEYVAYPYAAQTGDAIPYRGAGMRAEVLAGAAISALQHPLTSDGSGRAISAVVASSGTRTFVVGYPVDTAAGANETIRLDVIVSYPVLV
jgi:hypothetical protein